MAVRTIALPKKRLGMPISLVLSGVAIVAVAASTIGGTLAYFSGTQDQNTSINTATVGINATSGYPLNFTNLVPGETQANDVAVQNTSSVPADLYVQLLSNGVGTNFCAPPGMLSVRIEDLNVGGDWYNGDICNLFPGWSGSTIAKVGDDVAAGATKNYRIHVTLAATAGNSYQNASNTDTAHLIAVQSTGPAPIPDKQGGTAQDAWPADAHGGDDDLNYN